MKIVKKTILSLAVVAMLLMMSCGNGNKPSALVEHWFHESGSTEDKAEDMELFKDGTGVCDGITISWKVENKRFIMQSSSGGFACDYNLSGSTLTLIYNDGDSVVYVTKAEQERIEEMAAIAQQKALALINSFNYPPGQKYARVTKNGTKILEYLNPESPILDIARNGDIFPLTGQGETWCKVKVILKDTTGWLRCSSIEILYNLPSTSINGRFTDN